jgi:hypothetical protein
METATILRKFYGLTFGIKTAGIARSSSVYLLYSRVLTVNCMKQGVHTPMRCLHNGEYNLNYFGYFMIVSYLLVKLSVFYFGWNINLS